MRVCNLGVEDTLFRTFSELLQLLANIRFTKLILRSFAATIASCALRYVTINAGQNSIPLAWFCGVFPVTAIAFLLNSCASEIEPSNCLQFELLSFGKTTFTTVGFAQELSKAILRTKITRKYLPNHN